VANSNAMKYITFFHNSDEYREAFTHRDKGRPCFYWFSDSWFCHIGFRDYFYLFVKNPKTDSIKFETGWRDGGLNGLNDRYLSFLEKRDAIYNKTSSLKYAEPPILSSFSRIEPDIIAKYKESIDKFIIIKPQQYRGISLPLFKNKIPQRIDRIFDSDYMPNKFIAIEEILTVVPNIKDSYPFIGHKATLSKGKEMFR